jgi:hypothetical protein
MAAIDQIEIARTGARNSFGAGGREAAEAADERAARRTLRDQIARLERELSAVAISAYPRVDSRAVTPPLAGPRLLSLGELERVRDALADRLSSLRSQVAEQEARQAGAARELERMLADPPAHKWRRITHADLGLPGCGDYHVRPKAGLLGMLMGWWQVVVSSGCP